MATMSKKKAAQDRHSPHRLVRVPIDLYERLKALADRNDRPVSRELKRAIEGHLRSEGEMRDAASPLG
jgi:predicted DNA-binding protein